MPSTKLVTEMRTITDGLTTSDLEVACDKRQNEMLGEWSANRK
jgi:hypothetical protein